MYIEIIFHFFAISLQLSTSLGPGLVDLMNLDTHLMWHILLFPVWVIFMNSTWSSPLPIMSPLWETTSFSFLGKRDKVSQNRNIVLFLYICYSIFIHFDLSASLSDISWRGGAGFSSSAVNVFKALYEVMLEVRFRNSITQLGGINGAAAIKCAVSVSPGPNSRDHLSVHTTGRWFLLSAIRERSVIYEVSKESQIMEENS